MSQDTPKLKQPTAKEALTKYFLAWAPEDPSLQVYLEYYENKFDLLKKVK